MFASLVLSALLLAQPTPTDFGPWNGVIDCESGGVANIENPTSTASGLWQFLDTSWDWTAEHAGRWDLVGTRAKDASVADQWAMAEHLRTMPGGGISHWLCGYRYGDGTGPISVAWDPADRVAPQRRTTLSTPEPTPVFEVFEVPTRSSGGGGAALVM